MYLTHNNAPDTRHHTKANDIKKVYLKCSKAYLKNRMWMKHDGTLKCHILKQDIQKDMDYRYDQLMCDCLT